MIVTRMLPGGRKVNLEFVSKDPLIAKHYADTFGNQFLDDVAKARPLTSHAWTHLYRRWEGQMLEEAKTQEHYDYWTDDKGVRHPLYETRRKGRHSVITDNPLLMIPAVVKVL